MKGSRSDRTRLLVDAEAPKWVAPIVNSLNNHSDDLKALDRGISLAKNTNCELRELAFQMPLFPPADSSFLESVDWSVTNADPGAGFVLLPGGELRGYGQVTGITIAAGTTLMATLPEGWRPGQTTAVPVSDSAGAIAALTISTAGAVNYISGPTGAPVISLDPVQLWVADAASPSQFAGNGWPIRVQHRLGMLAGIIPMRCVMDEPPLPSTGHGLPYLDWSNVDQGQARLNGAWGLQWGKRYRLTMLLVPQE